MKEFFQEVNLKELIISIFSFFAFLIGLCLIYDLDDYAAFYLFSTSTVAFFTFIYLLIKKHKEVNQFNKNQEVKENEI